MFNSEIKFSHPSGFYEENISLQIHGGGTGKIYYTLDGSEPTQNSLAYEKNTVILITNASLNENVYSARADTSTGFHEELTNEYIGSPADTNGAFTFEAGYTVPDFKVDKCTIIRASVFDEDGQLLDNIVGTYFVGFENKPEYHNIYTIAISTDPDNLFGYENGIMVTGKVFDDYLKTRQTENGYDLSPDSFAPHWWWWPANYRQDGRAYERPAHITIFDNNFNKKMDQACGIRIHGAGSKGYVSKSIRCTAREEYAGSNTFNLDCFGHNISPHKFLIFSGGDDYRFKMKDYLGSALAQSLNVSTMHFIPCSLFINGEYWGFYFITEHYNKYYISDHYGVKVDNIVMIKNSELKEGNQEDLNLFVEMRDYISNNDMSLDTNYQKACELIDIDSFIDYYALGIYIGRYNDWPHSNYALWRTRNKEGSSYGDCKWRWMSFDLNSSSMVAQKSTEDSLAYVLEVDPLFASLFNAPEFRQKFADRILYIGSTLFNKETCDVFIDNFDTSFRLPIQKNSLRFFNSTKEKDYDAYIEGIRSFFDVRFSYISQYVSAHLEEYNR